MYLSRNPRCALSAFLVRGFRATASRSRPRWPEEDPTKPPLRLNIPRDASGPSSLTQHISQKRDTLHDDLFESAFAYEPEGTETGIQIVAPPKVETKPEPSEKSEKTPGGTMSDVKVPNEAPVSQATPEEVASISRPRNKYKLKRLRRRDLIGVHHKVDDGIRILMDTDRGQKNNVLTIKIGLGDRVEGVDEYSKEYFTSSGEINSLAEAIVKDLKPYLESKSDEDEACIVVINIVDRDDVPSEKAASEEVKVRDLELTNVMDNVLFKTDGSSRQRGTHDFPRHKALERKEFRGLSYVAPSQTDASPSSPPPSPRKLISPRTTQTARVHAKSRVILDYSQSKGVKFAAKTKPAMVTKTQTQHLVEARVTRPIEYASDREMRMRPKMEPENYFEKKVDQNPLNHLKPLAREITLIDDIPERLKYPEYKYVALRHNKTGVDDDTSSVQTIRRYHVSCKRACKLTEGIGEDTPRLVILDKDVAKSEKAPINKMLSPDRVRLAKGETSRKGGTAKLSDLKSGNDVYLQEGGDAIGDLARADSVGHAPDEAARTATLKDVSDGRYEMDITDSRKCEKPEKILPPKSCRDIAAMSSEEFVLNRSCLNAKEVVASVTPKMSDHIVNLANEDLAKTETDLGGNPVDSLSMMKRVKEMVDLDLKNAEKIFVTSHAKDPPEDSSGTKSPTEEIFTPVDKTGEASEGTVSLFQGTLPYPVKSVIIYDELTNSFYLHAEELEALARECNSQTDDSLLKMIDPVKHDFAGDISVFMDVLPIEDEHKIVNWVLKSGDSIVVYDEETNTFRVDFNLLKNPPRFPDPKPTSTGRPFDVPSEQQHPEHHPPSGLDNSRLGKQESTEATAPVMPPQPAQKPPSATTTTKTEKSEIEKREKKLAELKRRVQRESKDVDAQEIRKQNSDLYENVFVGIKKPEKKTGQEQETNKQQQPPPTSGNSNTGKKAADATEQRYVSDNIVEMSKTSAVDKAGPKIRIGSKIETVKVKMTPVLRPPLKVTEINLNKKCDDAKDKEEKGGKDDPKKRKPQTNGAFYKKFEKYKSPFSDPEYEEKPMKINSDLESNPNLKKLDSWNKTLVLQEFTKTSSSSPDNIENWLKDETDKMATLLLKVLQDAADGNTGRSRRTAPKSSGPGTGPSRGNPYETIRKKQEKNSAKRKKEAGDAWQPSRVFEEIRIYGKASPMTDGKHRGRRRSSADDWLFEVLPPDGFLSKEALKSHREDEIPGPDFLKRFSSFWKFLPELGCQATIFLLIRMCDIVKTGSSILSSNVSRIRRNPFGRLFTKYGPVVKLRGILSGDVVLINRPEDMSNVFAQSQSSPGRSVMDSVESCRTRVKERNFPVGITDSCTGAEWDLVRKSTIDVSSKGCLHYFTVLKNADSHLVTRIQSLRNKQDQVPDDFIDEIRKWSLEGLCSILFDKSLGFFDKKPVSTNWVSESERLIRHMKDATDHLCRCESNFQIWRFLNTPALRNLNQAYQSLDLILSKYVYHAEITLRKKRKMIISNKGSGNRNLNFLESVILNDGLTPDEITTNLIDILLIGGNTTTIALAFLLYNLAQSPRVQRQLFKEIKELLPEKSSQLNYHQLHSLKYLQACLKESLRFNIPVPMLLRVLPMDTAIANYRIPFGTHLILDTQTACMKEQCFEEPDKFKPERWLDQDCVHPFTSIPFCNGPRCAFVKRLAEIQLWTCAAKIIRNFEIAYHFGEIKGTGNVISYPDKPLKLTFIDRDE